MVEHSFWRLLWEYLHPHRRHLVISLLCAGWVGAMVASQSLVVRWIVDHGLLRSTPDGNLAPDTERLLGGLLWVGVYLLVSANRIGIGLYGVYHCVSLIESSLRDIRARFFRHVQSL